MHNAKNGTTILNGFHNIFAGWFVIARIPQFHGIFHEIKRTLFNDMVRILVEHNKVGQQHQIMCFGWITGLSDDKRFEPLFNCLLAVKANNASWHILFAEKTRGNGEIVIAFLEPQCDQFMRSFAHTAPFLHA